MIMNPLQSKQNNNSKELMISLGDKSWTSTIYLVATTEQEIKVVNIGKCCMNEKL